MKVENFKVINFIREFNVYVDKYLNNFPKKDIEIKNKIKNISFEILEIAYLINISDNLELKKDKIDNLIVKIKLLDFLIELCYEKEIINKNRLLKFGNKLDDIIKYTTGWKKKIIL